MPMLVIRKGYYDHLSMQPISLKCFLAFFESSAEETRSCWLRVNCLS